MSAKDELRQLLIALAALRTLDGREQLVESLKREAVSLLETMGVNAPYAVFVVGRNAYSVNNGTLVTSHVI